MGSKSRAIPFLAGGAIAAGAFVFFGWDLAHHHMAYSPNAPSPLWEKVWFVWLMVLLAPFIHWFRGRDVDTRPWTAGVIENSAIIYIPRDGSSYLLEVLYSFFANGRRYFGYYADFFETVREAEAVLAKMQASSPTVRYQSDDPLVCEILL